VPTRPLINEIDRYNPYIEEGKHEFNFRLSYDDMASLESNSDEFLNTPYGFNFYPHGDGNIIENLVEISNKNIALKAFYKEDDHYLLRFINNSKESTSTILRVKDSTIELHFNKYEVKTVVYDLKTINERENFIKD